MTFAPDLYFWLMGQILLLYIGIAFILCYFFRKFCQNPGDDDEDEDIEKVKQGHGEMVTGSVVVDP
jgi:heme/copper-type cytochrome/quinol oxidase subunit 2